MKFHFGLMIFLIRTKTNIKVNHFLYINKKMLYHTTSISNVLCTDAIVVKLLHVMYIHHQAEYKKRRYLYQSLGNSRNVRNVRSYGITITSIAKSRPQFKLSVHL